MYPGQDVAKNRGFKHSSESLLVNLVIVRPAFRSYDFSDVLSRFLLADTRERE